MGGKNVYGNIVSTVLLLAVVFFGYAVVTAIDLKRSREKELSQRVERLRVEVGEMRKELRSMRLSPVANVASGNKESTPSVIANHRFYDQNADFGGRMISAATSETLNMNSLINNESIVGSLWSMCCDSLAERDYEHPEKFEPKLAESWSVSKDKLVYTVKLRKGVLWQDFTDPVTNKEWHGVEVTAADFKFYVDAIKNPDTNCAPMRTYLINLDRVEVVSKYELKIYWKCKYFISKAITLGLMPLPRHLYHAYDGPFDGKKFNDDHQRNRLIVGCGPYRFVGWKKGGRVMLTRFENYFGSKYGVAPPIRDVALDVIKHKTTQLQALKSGEIDSMNLMPEQWIRNTNGPEFNGSKAPLMKYKYSGRMYRYIGYNMRRPIFKDKRVRQAMTHLIDRERIVKEVYHDLARVVTGSFFIDTPYYDKSIKAYAFSVAKAKELLAEAGWKDRDGDGILDKDGKKFEFTILSSNGNPNYDKILPMIKEDMAKAGVVVRIRSVEWPVFLQSLGKKRFDACICGWGLGFESDPYQLWHSSQADIPESSNHIGFKNKEADALIKDIRSCFDTKKRIELCHKFHRLLHEEQPYTFLFSPYSLMAQSRRYKNLRLDLPGGPPDRIQWTPKSFQKTLTE